MSVVDQPLCSIVIRCYNEAAHIGRLLQGIRQQTVDAVEIIVVDSGSTDDTVSIAKLYPTRVLSIRPEQFSFGRSLNVGCEAARGRCIVIVSAHVYPVYEDWLEQLLAPFDDERVALAYGKQRGDEVTRYSEHQVFAQWFPEEEHVEGDHPFCNNANAAIRRTVWEQLRYDETLTGLEDLDWARRAMRAGHRIVYAPEAEVVHVHNERPRSIFNRYRREAIAMKHIFPNERFTATDFVRLFFSNVWSDCRHAWRDDVFWRHGAEIVMFRFMQFFGTWRGYAQQGLVSERLRRRFYYPNAPRKPAGCARMKMKQPIDYSCKPVEGKLGRHY